MNSEIYLEHDLWVTMLPSMETNFGLASLVIHESKKGKVIFLLSVL